MPPVSELPAVALAMEPAKTHHVLVESDLARLAAFCRVLDTAPLREFGSPRTQELLAEASILITGWGCPRITPQVLRLAPRLRLIGHTGGTVKFLVGPEVFEAGIAVTQAAAANALPVAEFTLAAILFSNKRVLQSRDLYRKERSAAANASLGSRPIGNYAKTIGIIGASLIGRRVIELLRPFAFDVLLYDPFVRADEAARLGVRPAGLHELMRTSDVVSLHVPALPSTRHMIDGRAIALLRDGATFINTSRGGLVDHEALEAELCTGRIDAVLDVTEPEPLPPTSPLYDLPNVLLTPHVAGALGLERQRLGALIVDEVERFVRGEPLLYRIDPVMLDRSA
jgi:phosphoglycerate dehydrogenase-like enzyme